MPAGLAFHLRYKASIFKALQGAELRVQDSTFGGFRVFKVSPEAFHKRIIWIKRDGLAAMAVRQGLHEAIVEEGGDALAGRRWKSVSPLT